MVIITGASSGIGKACALSFAAQNHDLLLIARRGERLEKLAKEISVRHRKIKITPVKLDLQNRDAFKTFARKYAAIFSRAEILINNAGLAKGLVPFHESQPEEWDAMLETNVRALMAMTHLVLPHMIKNRSGHIINIGSVAGRWIYPKGNVYCASKAAVKAFTEALRLDLCGTGVRVTEICPGMVETEFSEVRLENKGKAKAVYQGMTPLTASDIAEAVVWCTARPKHVNVQDLVLYPTDQAAPTVVHRSAPNGGR